MSALISWRNAADTATLTATNIDTAFPLANLQERGLASVYQSNFMSVGSESVTATIAIAAGGVDAYSNKLNAPAYSFATQPDGMVLMGGAFTTSGEVSTRTLLRTYADGTLDDTFEPAVGTSGDILNTILLQSDGKILIGGTFSTVRGTSKPYYARLNANGTLDETYTTAVDSTVRALAMQSDGKVLAAGEFTTVGGTSRPRIARLNTNGTLDTGFTPGSGANNEVLRVLVQPDGKIVIAGRFTTFNGTTRSRIARLNTNGTLDTGFTPPTFDGDILALGRQSDGKIIVGGQFSTVGGTSRPRIARLNTNGTFDSTFNAAVSGTYVAGLIVDSAGRIVFGGEFTVVGGVNRQRIARVLATGAIDPSWNVEADTITEVAATANGKILIGGYFVAVSGRVRYSVARLLPDMRVPARVVGVLGAVGGMAGTLTIRYRERSDLPWGDLAAWDMASQYAGNRPPQLITTPAEGVAWAHGEYKIEFSGASGWTGYFGFARLWIGSAILLDQGVDAQWRAGFADTGTLDATDGGQQVPAYGVVTRTLGVSLSANSTELAWGFTDAGTDISQPDNLHALQIEAGTTGEVLAIPRASTPLWTHTSAIYGHIAQPWEIEHQAGPNWRAGFSVEEER